MKRFLRKFLQVQRLTMTNNMQLNDNKAGMQGLDKNKINAVIRKATEGTKYHSHQQKNEERLKQRITKQTQLINSLSQKDLEDAQTNMTRLANELERGRDLSRCNVHVDMDAFYAAVEMRDDPSLRNRPMAVGSNSMLSTSNYAARKFGVRAAMPGFIARKLCPKLTIIPCNFDKYTKISGEIREVMAEYDPDFCAMSLDEAYLDVTEFVDQRQNHGLGNSVELERVRYSGECVCWLPRIDSESEFEGSTSKSVCEKCGKQCLTLKDSLSFGNSVEEVVRELRFKIEQRTGLTASAGIAPNTLLAKVCSDMNKPNGQFYLNPDRDTIMEFISKLPTRKIPGIGSVTDSLLKGMGIETCKDLYEQRAKLYLLHSEIQSRFFLETSLGIESSFLSNDSDRKSISVERTFREKSSSTELMELCESLCRSLAEDIAEKGASGKTVTLKYKTVDFDIKTRANSVQRFISSFEDIFSHAKALLDHELAANGGSLKLRLMGVRLSNLAGTSENSRSPKKLTEITKFLNNPGTSKQEFSEKVDISGNEEDFSLRDLVSTSGLACPVCGHRIPGISDEIQMSRHVEECLNKQTVAEILKNDSKKSAAKRKFYKNDTKPSKMKRIDAYFASKNGGT